MSELNGVLCINKPQNMTSFDVVRHVRKTLNVKAGHSGTLDPMAEGVLVVAVNKATKALQYLDLNDKIYRATLTLGSKTDTGDIWGEVIDSAQVPPFNIKDVNRVLNELVGVQRQRVPMVSAKKIDGKKLYEYHRNNQFVETQYTDIEIYSIKLISITETTIDFEAHVSSGTYIRTLCEDIAEKLLTVGTMSALIRIQVGMFNLNQCIGLDELSSDVKLLNVKECITLPRFNRTDLEETLLHGKRVIIDSDEPLIFVDAGTVFSVCELESPGVYKIQRGLW